MYKFRCESKVGCVGDCCSDCSAYCKCDRCIYESDCPRAYTENRCDPEKRMEGANCGMMR